MQEHITDNKEGNNSAAPKKLTLESIMREYDAKRLSETKEKEPQDDIENDDFRRFKEELDSIEKGDNAGENEDSSDAMDEDADMKIVSSGSDGFSFGAASEKKETEDKSKIDIMNEISQRFGAFSGSQETVTQTENENKDDGMIPEKDAKISADSSVEEEIADTAPEAHVESQEELGTTKEFVAAGIGNDGDDKKSRIDLAALKRAFDDDDFDRYGAKKVKKNKEKDTDTQTPRRDAEKKRRYDVNGERIKYSNPFLCPTEEYTDEKDKAQFMTKLSKKLLYSCFAMAAVIILMLGSLYLEFAPSLGLPHLKAFEPGKFSTVFALADLQILFFGVIIKLESVIKGAYAIRYKMTSSESIAFLSVIASVLYTAAAILLNPSLDGIPLICSASLFSVMLLSVNDFFKARTEYMAFRIINSDNEKYALKNISATGEKTSDEITKFVPEDSNVLDARKTGFVEKFFTRNAKPYSEDRGTGALILIALGISLAAAVTYYLLTKSVSGALCGMLAVFIASAQPCAMICSSYPDYLYSDRASKKKCAFIGHNIGDEYDNVSVVSFTDTEVFPSKDVKVTNIRTYGDTRIDNVIVTMARIFGKVGGPLSDVFSNTLSGITIEHEDIKIIEVAPDGLWLKIDGENVYLGTKSYMNENNFEVQVDSADESFKQGCGGILYLATQSCVIAKFYIKYTLNPNFETLLNKLYTQKICARIKSLDPCINNDFIRASLRRPESLFSVVKLQSPEEFAVTEPSVSSGLVSASSEHLLIQAFLLIRSFRKRERINGVLKRIAVVASVLLAALVLVGAREMVATSCILLLNVFWTGVVYVLTKLGAK